MCVRALQAETGKDNQQLQAGRRGDGGGGGGDLAERGREKNESGLVCLVRSDNALLTGEGEGSGRERRLRSLHANLSHRNRNRND